MSFQDFIDGIVAGNSPFERHFSGDIVYSVSGFLGSDSAHAMMVSNAAEIARRLEVVDSAHISRVGDCVHVIPFQDNGEPTVAALELMRIEDEMGDYPILDEDGYYALCDEYVDENWEEYEEESRELIEGGDAEAIENAVDCHIDAKGILSAKDDAAVEELARAIAEKVWAE